MAVKKGMEVATVDFNSFALANMDIQEFKEDIVDTFGKEGLKEYNLNVVKMPTGTTKFFQIPSAESDEPLEEKEIQGVIVAWKTTRILFPRAFNERKPGEMPLCTSDDGEFGMGAIQVGGKICKRECDSCPMNVYQPCPDNVDRKPCQERLVLFVLRENDYLPLVISASPASIKGIKRYFTQLMAEGGNHYTGVITAFTLVSDESKGGVKYSKLALRKIKKLSPEEKAMVKSYGKAIKQIISSTSASQAEGYADINDPEEEIPSFDGGTVEAEVYEVGVEVEE